MPNGDKPRGLLPHSRAEKRVNDLRDFETPGPVRVYLPMKDGALRLLRTEQASEISIPFGRYNGRKQRTV